MEQNQTFTDKHLASMAAIMLLAPAVSFMLKEKDIDVTSDEEGYVRSYIRYGYWILMVLGLALVVWAVYSFFFPYAVLYWINYALLAGVIGMIVFGVFSVINNKSIIHSMKESGPTEYNPSLILYFIPLYNYYIRYNEPLDNHNYRWIKESVLLWSLYMLLISVFPFSGVIILGLFVIVARAIMVTVGMDILSMNTKNKLNALFSHNIEEFIAYPLGVLIHTCKKLFRKSSTLHDEILTRKQTYAHLDPLGNRRTIISYIMIIAGIGYRGYTAWISVGPTVGLSMVLLPQILLLGKIAMTAPCGKLPRVPLLYSLLGGKKEKSASTLVTTPAKTEMLSATLTQQPIQAAKVEVTMPGAIVTPPIHTDTPTSL